MDHIPTRFLLMYVVGFFLVLSALMVAISVHSLRALRHIAASEIGCKDAVLLRFLVLLHIFDLLRLANLISLVLISIFATIHVFVFARASSHYPLLIVVGLLWLGGCLTNSLLQDMRQAAHAGLTIKT